MATPDAGNVARRHLAAGSYYLGIFPNKQLVLVLDAATLTPAKARFPALEEALKRPLPTGRHKRPHGVPHHAKLEGWKRVKKSDLVDPTAPDRLTHDLYEYRRYLPFAPGGGRPVTAREIEALGHSFLDYLDTEFPARDPEPAAPEWKAVVIGPRPEGLDRHEYAMKVMALLHALASHVGEKNLRKRNRGVPEGVQRRLVRTEYLPTVRKLVRNHGFEDTVTYSDRW